MDVVSLKTVNLLHSIYPVLAFCRVLGFLPVKFEGNSVTFKWISIPTIYTLAFSVFSGYLSSFNFDFQRADSTKVGRSFNTYTPQNESYSNGSNTRVIGVEEGESLKGVPDVADLLDFPRVVLNFVMIFMFQCLVVGAFSCACKIPEYYSNLEKSFHAIFIGLAIESEEANSVKRSHAISRLKMYTVRSIGFYGLLMIINLVLVTLDTFSLLNAADYHPLMYSGYFIWQILFASHVLVSIFATVIVLVLKHSFEEINEQLEKAIRFQNGNDDEGEQEGGQSSNSNFYNRSHHQHIFEIESTCTTKSKWRKKRKDKMRGIKPNFNQSFVTAMGDDEFFDMVDRKDCFPREFRRLKTAYLICESLVNRPGFLASGFLFIEFCLALLSFIRIPVANYRNSWTIVDVIFQCVLHSFFLARFVFIASAMSGKAKKTQSIFLALSFKNIPNECHSEIEIFATKLMISKEPVISVLGLQLNRALLETLKLTGLVGTTILAFVIYIFYAIYTIIAGFKFDPIDGDMDFDLFNVSAPINVSSFSKFFENIRMNTNL